MNEGRTRRTTKQPQTWWQTTESASKANMAWPLTKNPQPQKRDDACHSFNQQNHGYWEIGNRFGTLEWESEWAQTNFSSYSQKNDWIGQQWPMIVRGSFGREPVMKTWKSPDSITVITLTNDGSSIFGETNKTSQMMTIFTTNLSDDEPIAKRIIIRERQNHCLKFGSLSWVRCKIETRAFNRKYFS